MKLIYLIYDTIHYRSTVLNVTGDPMNTNEIQSIVVKEYIPWKKYKSSNKDHHNVKHTTLTIDKKYN
jgi:hypothetical protein